MDRLTIILAVVLLAACTNAPFARIDGDGGRAAMINRFDVIIVGVNERWYPTGFDTRNVPPGRHAITFQSTFPGAELLQYTRTIEFDFEPCVRYFFFANHRTELSPRDWTVELDRTRPLAGCSASTASID